MLFTTIIPIVGAQYAANPKDETAALSVAEREARTIALLRRVESQRGLVMLIAEPTNRHNPLAIKARHMGVSVGYVADDYLEVVHQALRCNGGRPLLARVTEVRICRHGYLQVALPQLVAIGAVPVHHEVDWAMWMADVPLLPVREEQYCQTEAEAMLELTPFTHDQLPQLTFYIDLWLKGSANDLSCEARQCRTRYIELLEASADADVRALSEEVKHQRNALCGDRMMQARTGEWWSQLLASSDMAQLWQTWQLRCDRHHWHCLRLIDDMLRQLPGKLYDDVGDLRQLLSRLYYLKVPRVAYQSILTLLLVRELTCRELGIDTRPLAPTDYQADALISDMEQMPVTIGQVLHFGRTQCTTPQQRATIQTLAYWLRDEYTHSHCLTADQLTQPSTDMAQLTDAVREALSRPTIQNNYAPDSIRFEAGSSQNGDVVF